MLRASLTVSVTVIFYSPSNGQSNSVDDTEAVFSAGSNQTEWSVDHDKSGLALCDTTHRVTCASRLLAKRKARGLFHVTDELQLSVNHTA